MRRAAGSLWTLDIGEPVTKTAEPAERAGQRHCGDHQPDGSACDDLFTTGRERRSAPVPTVKISTNDRLYQQKRKWIDLTRASLCTAVGWTTWRFGCSTCPASHER